MSHATVDEPFPLRLLTGDGDTTLYPVARLYDAAGSLVATVPLPHIAEGLYGADWTPSALGHFTSVFTVYSDAGHLSVATYDREGDDIEVTTTVSAALLDEVLEDHLAPGTAGEALALTLGLAGHHNRLLDQATYNASGLMTSARIRVFSTPEDLIAGTNALGEWSVETTPSAAPNAHRPTSYLVRRVS